MKVFIAVLLTVASASALGSGPYLPSGWRPEGPAFFLPSEVQKPSQNFVQETIASGSDSLREYGPPKVQEVSQDIANQGLPDVATEQTFAVEVKETNANIERISEVSAGISEITAGISEIAAGISEVSAGISAVEVGNLDTVVNFEQLAVEDEATQATLVEEASTTAALVEEKQTEEESVTESDIVSEERTTENTIVDEKLRFEGRSLVTDIAAEEADKIAEEKFEVQTTESVKDGNIVEVIQDVVEATSAGLEKKVEKIEEIVQLEVKTVKDIEEALVNLEKTEQEQSNIAIKKVQEISGTSSVPEGFLEYGPPGFREYGPPEEDIIRPAVDQVSTNDLSEKERKRRFSPKFRPSKGQPKRGH